LKVKIREMSNGKEELDCNVQSISGSHRGSLTENIASWQGGTVPHAKARRRVEKKRSVMTVADIKITILGQCWRVRFSILPLETPLFSDSRNFALAN